MRCTLAVIFVLTVIKLTNGEWSYFDSSSTDQDFLNEIERELESPDSATDTPPEDDTTDVTHSPAPTDIPPPDGTEDENGTTAPTDVPPPVETRPTPTNIPPPIETTAAPTEVPPTVETTPAPTEVPPPVETTAAPTEVPPPVETTAAPTEVPPPIKTTATPTDIAPPDNTTDEDDKDDSGKDNLSALLHELRGSCDVISAAGPYFFSHFPEGAVLDYTISLTPVNFTKDISLFVKAGKFAGNKRVYIRALVDAIGFKIMKERMMCPGVKLQQAIIYVMRKELNTQMATDNGTLYSELLRIYDQWFPWESNHKRVQGSVRFAHGIVFEEVIDYILRSQFEGLTKMISRFTKSFQRRSTRVGMTMDRWKKVLKRFLRGYAPVYQCPSKNRALRIFNDIVNNVRMRIIEEPIKKEIENTLKTLMVEHMDLSSINGVDAFIGDVVDVFMRYVDKVIKQFNTFEKHLQDKDYTKIAKIVKEYLDDRQRKVMDDLLQWLSSSS